MWLREFTVSNFRRIENLTISFPRGLCAIVGENNTGKTAIIDSQKKAPRRIKPNRVRKSMSAAKEASTC